MNDPREMDHDYGEVWQAICKIPIGTCDRIWGVDLDRLNVDEFIIDDAGEPTCRAGVCDYIVERHYSQEWPGLGDAWSGGFAKNH